MPRFYFFEYFLHDIAHLQYQDYPERLAKVEIVRESGEFPVYLGQHRRDFRVSVQYFYYISLNCFDIQDIFTYTE